MKIQVYFLVFILAAGMFSCKKDEGGASAEDKAKAEAFKTYVASKQFRISEYYADKPIDYIEDDEEVRAETDLMHYVSIWIKDDSNIFDFNTGKVTIIQNTHKVPGNDADQITRDISVGADKGGAYLNFLSYLYEPLKY